MGALLVTKSQLKCFFAVVKYGSFSLAAKHLYIAQPAVSKQIRTLEEELNIKLFQRNPQSVTLTDQGNIIYLALAHCQETFQLALNEARQKGAMLERDPIRMGCPLFWNTDSIYQPISEWVEKNYSWMRLTLNAYTQQSILEHLRRGDIDVAIHTEDAEPQPGLVTRPFGCVNSVLLFSAQSPLARTPRGFDQVEQCTLMTTFDITAPIYHELLDALTRYLGAKKMRNHILDDISEIYAYLEDPMNMFLSSELFLWKSDPLLRYITLPIPRKLFVTVRETEMRPEVLRFAGLLIREFSRFVKTEAAVGE